MSLLRVPNLTEIKHAKEKLAPYVLETPTLAWDTLGKQQLLGGETEVFLKLELFQRTGTFKARGALNNVMNLSDEQRRKGITAVSAGNHAMAVAYAAKVLGSHAKVTMPKTADPFRVQKSQDYGAEVELYDTIHEAFHWVEQICELEGRTFVHPFDGVQVTEGSATLGLEWHEQVRDLDAVIVSIGGGGLCSGVALATKLLHPECQVFGVEPKGASSMSLSLQAGSPQKIEMVQTIADSLGAPHAEEYSFRLCQQHVDEVVLVSDSQLTDAMKFMFEDLKLVVEPAGAAALAALLGPLKERLQGKRVGVLVCGGNVSLQSFFRLVSP